MEDFFTMKIKFVLKDTLELLKISPNQLSVKSGVRNNTVYDMIDDRTKRIDRKNLENIIRTLNEIGKKQGIKKKFSLEDVMIWIEE